MLSGVSDVLAWVLMESLMLRWLFCLLLRLRGDLLPAAAACVSVTACWPDGGGSSGTHRCHQPGVCGALFLIIWAATIGPVVLLACSFGRKSLNSQVFHSPLQLILPINADISLTFHCFLIYIRKQLSVGKKMSNTPSFLKWAEMINWRLNVNFVASTS